MRNGPSGMGYFILKEFLLSTPESEEFQIDTQSLKNKLIPMFKKTGYSTEQINLSNILKELKRESLLKHFRDTKSETNPNPGESQNPKSVFVNVGWIPKSLKDDFLEDKEDEDLRFGKAEGLIRRSEVSLYESDNPNDTHFFFFDLESISQKSEFDSNTCFYIGADPSLYQS